jgi:hypothetical protein
LQAEWTPEPLFGLEKYTSSLSTNELRIPWWSHRLKAAECKWDVTPTFITFAVRVEI